MTSETQRDSLGAPLESLAFNYDLANRVDNKTVNGVFTDYDYDATNELTLDGATGFSYDLTGDRNMAGYVIGADNRIAEDGTWHYSYDGEGNQTSKVLLADDGTYWTYEYDHENHLISADQHIEGAPAAHVDYSYDALGRRVTRAVGSNVERYVYDGQDKLMDLDGAGNLVMRRSFGVETDEAIARIDASGDTGWYLTDSLGSVVGLVNAAGAPLGFVNYNAYGQIVADTLGANGDRYRFTGRELDPITGLQDNRERQYAPDQGGFTSEDPIGFSAGDWDLNRYVGNSPTNGTDPDGMEEQKREYGWFFSTPWIYATDKLTKGTSAEEAGEWFKSVAKTVDISRYIGGQAEYTEQTYRDTWRKYNDENLGNAILFALDRTIKNSGPAGNAARGIDELKQNLDRGENLGTASVQSAAKNGFIVNIGGRLYEAGTGTRLSGPRHGQLLDEEEIRTTYTGAVWETFGIIALTRELKGPAPRLRLSVGELVVESPALGIQRTSTQNIVVGSTAEGVELVPHDMVGPLLPNQVRMPAPPVPGPVEATTGTPARLGPALAEVPSIRNGAFHQWFNDLTPAELREVWGQPKLRAVVEARLRSPGGFHEWLPVSRAPKFKEWGVTAEQIQELRTATSEVKFKPSGQHGAELSTTAHNEIFRIVDTAPDYASFKTSLQQWAEKRLEGGAGALPAGLRR